MVKGLRPDDMAVVTMCGMVDIPHAVFVATNDLPQVTFVTADMGGNQEATIEYLKAKIALASLVCYNELHNVFWLKCVFQIKALFGFYPKAKGVCPRLCACIDRQDEQWLALA